MCEKPRLAGRPFTVGSAVRCCKGGGEEDFVGASLRLALRRGEQSSRSGAVVPGAPPPPRSVCRRARRQVMHRSCV